MDANDLPSTSEASEKNETIEEGRYVIICKEGILKVCRVNPGQVYAVQKLRFRLDDAIGWQFGTYCSVQPGGLLTKAAPPAPVSREQSTAPNNEATEYPKELAFDKPNDASQVNGHELPIESTDDRDADPQLLSQNHLEAAKLGLWKSNETVDRLTKGNVGFSARTDMSKEKYVKKKRKKYTDQLLMLRPSIRLIWHNYFHKDPDRLDNMTLTSLGLLLGYANVHSGSSVCVFDFCLGMVTASVIQRLSGNGTCTHVHQHDNAQSIPFVHAMNFSEEDLATFKTVPGYDFLEEQNLTDLTDTYDAMIVASVRFDLTQSLVDLVRLLKPSSYLVVLACSRALKSLSNVVDVSVIESSTFEHQVLPDRTHPVMKQNVGRGYVLYAIKVLN